MQEIEELMQAITALETQRPKLGDDVVDSALEPLHVRLAALDASQPAGRQRRLVTILFLDIVNSTSLSQGLEPEEVQEIIGGTLKRLSFPIESHGGQITQFMGDGFVAVFGLRHIHENDARQAVRAGLAILGEANACAADLENHYGIRDFMVRIGINTGRVVPGRFSEGESPVMGLTVSLAARMEQAALPGSLFISQFTYQHVRRAFEVNLLPSIAAKGFPQPITVYQVLSARPRTFRTFTRGVEGVETTLIGRADELHQLKLHLKQAVKNRQTRLVTILGDAGVGKSRLLYEFDKWLAQPSRRVMAFKARASPQMTSIPFGMLREMISYHLELLSTDPAQLTRQRLVERLASIVPDQAEMKAHFIGSLLGFDFSASPFLRGVQDDPNQLQERAWIYLTECFSKVANLSPTVIMLDDLHWADAPSVSFISHLMKECPGIPLLIICLARPALAERFPDWGTDQPAVTPLESITAYSPHKHTLELAPLSRENSLALMDEILRNVEELPVDLRDRILDCADGNPFYLEEYIQSLVDAGVIQCGPGETRWKLDAEKLGRLELPNTLAALLEARLDNLSLVQRVLVQQAAVIGRVFWRAALQAVHGKKPIIEADLEDLSRRGFIIPQETSTFAGTDEYRFHHALLRDAAYQTLVKRDRQAYHDQVAGWIIVSTLTSQRSGEFAPIIAGHYEAAGRRELAADWYIQSGKTARKQGAPTQARLFFDRALGLLPANVDATTPTVELDRHWQALLGRDDVLGILGDTEGRLADDTALVMLARIIGNEELLAEAYYRQGYYLGVKGQYRQEWEVYNLGLEASRRIHDLRYEALILGLKVFCAVHLGDLEAAAQTSQAALHCAESLGDLEVLARTLTNVSLYYTETGDMARSARMLEHQLEINQQIGNIEGQVIGLSNLGYVYILLGMPAEAIPVLQRCTRIAWDNGIRSFFAYSRLNLGLAYLRNGNPVSAVTELEECLPDLHSMNDILDYGTGHTYMAMASELGGQVDQALALYNQAAEVLKGIGTMGNMFDAEAGVARCLLAVSDRRSAVEHVFPLQDYLKQYSGAGMEFPVLAYETCADVFTALGETAQARRAVGAGYGELLVRAGKISLPEWRKSFMERVPEHQRIRMRWLDYMNATQE
ncbi:MAG: hypothetical protein FIA98_07115 [Anaerolineae bacterium]|nr:hypothetical protein [Anaerolineae bacterium]